MKKNILLVRYLVIVPIISSSLLFGMEPTPKTRGASKRAKKLAQSSDSKRPRAETPVLTASNDQVKKEEAPVVSETTPALESDKVAEPTEVVQQDATQAPAQPVAEAKISKIPSEETVRANFSATLAGMMQAITDKAAKNTAIATKNATTPVDFAVSMYDPEPTIKNALGWGEWAQSSWDPISFSFSAIENKTFDPLNKKHIETLMAAADKLVYGNQLERLDNLLDLCRTNYPNIEFHRLTARRIKNFLKHSEQTSMKEFEKITTAENQKLISVQGTILNLSAEQVEALAKKLSDNQKDLQAADAKYAITVGDAFAKNRKTIETAEKAKATLLKFRRDLPQSEKPQLDYRNNEYALLKTRNTNKEIETHLQGMQYTLQNLGGIQNTISSTLHSLPAKKEAVAQIANK